MSIESLTTCDMCRGTHLREGGCVKPPEDWAELELSVATPHEWKTMEGYWVLCPNCIVKVENFINSTEQPEKEAK